jgi:tetratricopeptide (TPR) repeat protein
MKLITASLLTLGLAFGSTSAFAAGTTPPASGTVTSPKQMCKPGEVVVTVHIKGKPDKKVCKKSKAELVPDEELFQQGRLLAKQGEYDWALTVLASVKNQNDPDVLNYMGYSNRKAGHLDIAISYYNRALEINPNYVLAREYLGEGYVAAGKLDLAKIQLQEIANRAGTTSEEYIDLNKAITGTTI